LSEPLTDVREVLVAGDAFGTSYYLYAARENPRWQDWTFSKARGDGTVPVWSAARTSDGSLAGSLPSFSEHATIFDDRNVEAVFLRELVSNAPPQVSSSENVLQLTTTAGVKSVRLIDVDIEPKSVSPADSAQLSVTIDFDDQIQRGEFLPAAQLIGPNGPVALTVVETTPADLQTGRQLKFSARVPAPAVEGAWRIDVLFAGQSRHSVYLDTWRQG
jgi:hypothetical protein